MEKFLNKAKEKIRTFEAEHPDAAKAVGMTIGTLVVVTGVFAAGKAKGKYCQRALDKKYDKGVKDGMKMLVSLEKLTK